MCKSALPILSYARTSTSVFGSRQHCWWVMPILLCARTHAMVLNSGQNFESTKPFWLRAHANLSLGQGQHSEPKGSPSHCTHAHTLNLGHQLPRESRKFDACFLSDKSRARFPPDRSRVRFASGNEFYLLPQVKSRARFLSDKSRARFLADPFHPFIWALGKSRLQSCLWALCALPPKMLTKGCFRFERMCFEIGVQSCK